MANTTNLLEALSSYKGDQASLSNFVAIAKQELGDEWTSTIYQTLPNLPNGLKEKLDHAFQYNGASLAWTEIQSYLSNKEPLDIEHVSKRVETLDYWLKFFGDAGETVIQQLKDKLEQEKKIQETIPVNETDFIDDTSFVEETHPVSDPSEYSADEENYPAENLQSEIYDENTFTQESSEYSTTDNNEYYEEPAAENYTEDNYQQEEYTGYDEEYVNNGYISEEYSNQNEEYYQDTYQDNAYDDASYDNTTYTQENNLEEYSDQNYQQEEYSDNGYYDDAYTDHSYAENEYIQDADDSQNEEQFVSLEDQEAPFWRTPVYEPQQPETNEEFMSRKVFHQIDFLTAVRCWINARCISLGNKEIYSYRHYGFLIDIMEETKKDLEIVLGSPTYYPAVEQVRPDGIKQLQSFLKSLESDLKTAYDNLPSELTDLISDSTNVNDLKKMLGALDTSDKPELLGVAPDGFEMLDDPFDGIDTEKTKIPPSQKDQNGIQKKKTFSFNKKNAS